MRSVICWRKITWDLAFWTVRQDCCTVRPMLYRVRIENNERIQEWLEDDEIQQWLDSWDYKEYIRNNLVEYTHMNGHFTKYYMGKGCVSAGHGCSGWNPCTAGRPVWFGRMMTAGGWKT